MKINYKIFSILAFTSLLFVSCDEGDNVIDEVTEGTLRGGILRTINVTSNELPIGVASGFFGVDLEVQSEQEGTLVETIDVFATFRDNTPDNGKGATSSEAMVETISKSAFTIGEFGFPRFSYTASLPTLLSTTGVSEDDIDGGDQFRVRFEIVMNDGRRYSVAQNSGTITASFFQSPFQYSATIVCPPAPPTPGDWTFDMVDAYGDSWNGASLTVTLDGVEIPFLVDAAEATASVETLTVPPGAQVISIKFNSGSFDGEVGFTVTSASGNVVTSKVPYGAATPVGVELINYCVQNY